MIFELETVFSRLSVALRQKWCSPSRKHLIRAFRICKQIEKRIKTRAARFSSWPQFSRARARVDTDLDLAMRVLILFSICLRILKALNECFRGGDNHFCRSATESLEKMTLSSKIVIFVGHAFELDLPCFFCLAEAKIMLFGTCLEIPK